MKKLMTIAFAALFATYASAQNPAALKQIKKAKTYAEAQSLIKTNEASMTAAENAQAYAKLVDISYKSVSEAHATITTSQAMEQMGQASKEKVDMNAFYNDLYVTLQDALVCDKYDAQPNEKGKVDPKFRSKNAGRLNPLRVNIINGGQDAQQAEDIKKAADYYGMYVTTGVSDLFKDVIAAQAKQNPEGIGDQYLSEVARVASICSFQAGELKKAITYAEVVMQDPAKEKEGLQLKMYLIEQDVKTHEDSLRCLDQLKEIAQKNPKNNDVFAQLAQWYNNLGYTDQQEKLIEERLASDPNNFTAWAMKGQNAMNAQKYDDAIASFKKSLDCTVQEEKQKALIFTYIGFCYNSKAAAAETYDTQIAILKESMPYLEKAREIDPERERANWAYPLYQCYYNIYGEDDAKTKEVEALQNK